MRCPPLPCNENFPEKCCARARIGKGPRQREGEGGRTSFALARVEIGEGADGDRLERGARAVGADFRDGFAERVGDDGGDDRAADPALAGSHAATGERLELVWTLRAEPRGAADPADRHLLAAARDDFVLGRDQDRRRRAVEPVEKRPQRPFAIERRPDRHGAAVALGFADMTEPGRCVERGQASRQCRRLGPGDAAAITGDGDVRQARLPPPVERRPPAQLALVPVVPQLQGEAHLDVRDDAFVQKQMIGSELAAVPGDALEAALPDRAQPAHPAPDRDAGASRREDQTQSFRQHPTARPDAVELPRRGEVILQGRRLEQRNRRRAGARELRRDEVEKRSLSRQHGAAFRDEIG